MQKTGELIVKTIRLVPLVLMFCLLFNATFAIHRASAAEFTRGIGNYPVIPHAEMSWIQENNLFRVMLQKNIRMTNYYRK